MSKKAKTSRAAKRLARERERSTNIITGINRDRDDLRATIRDRDEVVIPELRAEIAKITKQADEANATSSRMVTQQQHMRDKIDDLKLIISGLEKACAENLGTIRALNRQLDQAAPKVMVTPPRLVSPHEAAQFFGQGGRIESNDLELGRMPSGPGHKKHWSQY